MNKQEAIEKIEKRKSTLNGWEELTRNNALNDALAIVRKLDEPEKPVVPQFVAEYIEYCKHEKFYALHGAYADMDDRLKCWRFKGNNSELFAKAWIYGYEVEKEKLYTVEIPNPNGFIRLVLCKDCDGKLFVATFSGGDCWENFGKCKITESEIKKDFAWAWEFAEEV